MNRTYLLLLVFAATTVCATAQIRFRLAGGMSTDWITSDNAATYRLAPPDTVSPAGGGFDGAQLGWGLRGYVDLDKQKKFRVPVGLDVFYYRGAQSIASDLYSIRVQHQNTLTTALAGFEWSFIEFPWAFARAYVGVEARMLFVNQSQIKYEETQLVNGVPQYQNVEYGGKDPATRLGGLIRFGLEGEIYYPVFINTSVGWGSMNLIGRDERPTSDGGRGQLLTPSSTNEGPEQLLYHVNFTFMVQVRL